ncbi:hypothetical protein [Streptomyces katrae]|uniref:hypothetical protein n=1 Tax=Streptomyces katrae TaxID=68223 RepID=UPI0012FF3F76|nr:hypothetical protein [Streptomyces katrae]
MINDLESLPKPALSPPVFDDPHGHRRRIVTVTGVMVGLLCLCVLAIGASVLYADPQPPATHPAEAVEAPPLPR